MRKVESHFMTARMPKKHSQKDMKKKSNCTNDKKVHRNSKLNGRICCKKALENISTHNFSKIVDHATSTHIQKIAHVSVNKEVNSNKLKVLNEMMHSLDNAKERILRARAIHINYMTNLEKQNIRTQCCQMMNESKKGVEIYD